MRITDIKRWPVWVGRRNQLVVKVETDAGVYGWGESGLSGRELAVIGAIDHYREFLIGKDAMNIGALWQEAYRSQYFEGGRVLTAAISAIDIALHDAKGKALGVPVHQLLGGKHRDHIPCFASTSIGSLDETLDAVRRLIDDGWTTIRFGTPIPKGTEDGVFEPRESIAVAAEAIASIREEIGNEIVLGIDYHHRLNVAETASFCQKMPAGTLDFVEEPIRDEAPEAYETLRSMTDVPFAIGEEFASKWQFLPYIERGLTNFARVDICNVGGFTEAMKVAAMAEAHYIDLMPHDPLGPICTAASIQLCAAAPNVAWLEAKPAAYATPDEMTKKLFPVKPELDGTRFPVIDAPGLGIEVDQELLDSGDIKFWEPPHLRRRDGSYTNW